MWKIYYDDGSTFSDEDGFPHDAPPEGFIAVVSYYPDGERYILATWDFYCYDVDSDQWWGMDINGLHDRLRRNMVYAYKEGRTITSDQYQAIIAGICEAHPKRISQ